MSARLFTSEIAETLSAHEQYDWVFYRVREARAAAEAEGRTLGRWWTTESESGFRLRFEAWCARVEA